MMTAMARLPSNKTSASQQQQQQQQSKYVPVIGSNPSFAQSRGYWEMQQHPSPPVAFVRNHHRQSSDQVGE